MAIQALETDTLERLSSLEVAGHPVLSVYLDLDPSRFPTPAARQAQLGSLLGEAHHDAAEEDVREIQADLERIQTMLQSDPTVSRGAQAVAIFACAKGGILEAVRLPTPVEPIAVVDTVPWLEPLAAVVCPGEWGAAVVSRRDARLFRGGPGGLTQFAAIRDVVHRRHAQGGWSQARFERGIEEEVTRHVHGVAERLLRAHRRAPFRYLVVVASDELRPVVEHSLHRDLRDVLVGTVDADLENAPTEQIAQAITPVIEHIEREREHALVARIEQGIGTGGAAATGLDEVLSMLEQQRVATLLVPKRSVLSAGLCPRCGRLSTADDGRCPLDGAALAEVDAVEHAVNMAASQSVEIIVVRHEIDWLGAHGDFAAVLRW